MRGVARPPHIRVMVVAALIGLTAAGCGASSAPARHATAYFLGCPLLPRDPKTGLFLVPGGWLAGMSVEGTSCQFGKHLMTSVIADLDRGRGTNSYPMQVADWNCVSYDGNQPTCFRGRATLYAQYGLS